MSDFQAELVHDVDRRMALAREWDELVEEVRQLEGFEGFLRPPLLQTLLPAADDGPVAIINVSRWRCDALLVTREGVRSRTLADLTSEEATGRANTYLQTLQETERLAQVHLAAVERAENDGTAVSRHARVRAAQALMASFEATDCMLQETQTWLWDVVAEPVLDELGLLKPSEPGKVLPRLWWCPTGPLTLLPLHAAGYHGETGGAAPRTVMDHVVSSYTPTLRALLEARRPRQPQAAGGGPEADSAKRLLIVAVSEAPGQPALRNVARERETLIELFPEEQHTLLDELTATRDAVGHELRLHRWVHFSCHGDQNLAEPSEGGLLLHDGMFTVADISARQFQGEFAGLSACKTAIGGVDLLDEAITLAAALHYTGYRHVVATLWSVDDATTAYLFETVYRDLTAKGGFRPERAARAVHAATLALRDASPDHPSAWMPFTHTGP
jgi:hypothetical protein